MYSSDRPNGMGNFDHRLEGKLYVVKNVPGGLCQECGEKYVSAHTAERLNALVLRKDADGTEVVRVLNYPAEADP